MEGERKNIVGQGGRERQNKVEGGDDEDRERKEEREGIER